MFDIHIVWVQQIMAATLGMFAVAGMVLWAWFDRGGRLTAANRRLIGLHYSPQYDPVAVPATRRGVAVMDAWSARAPPRMSKP